jgi:hypothetical protein
VTGFYSIRYGTGGTEALFDSVLRGTAGRSEQDLWLDELLHRSPVGDDVALTINLPAQIAADKALGNLEGAIVIMDIETGAIVVMSSHPTYDPNHLDEQWDLLRNDARAPLINRATQGLFPVGDLARLIGLIGLYEAGATIPADPKTMPLAEMMRPLGEAGYLATAHQLGFSQTLPGLPSQPGLLPDFDNKGTVRDLGVTPLHLARVVAALESKGNLPTPVLSLDSATEMTPAFSSEAAESARLLLSPLDDRLIGWRGQATPKETGQAWLSWFVGLAPTTASEMPPGNVSEELILDPTQIETGSPPVGASRSDPARYVVVSVVVTDEPDSDLAFEIAKASLNVILE